MRTFREFILMFRRFKTAGILNIIGLAVAFAAFSVIVMQLVFQNGYDRFRPKSDRIFRAEVLFPTSMEYIAIGPMALGGYIQDRTSLVEDYFLLDSGGALVFRVRQNDGTEEKYKENCVQVTSSFVGMLGMEVVEGNGQEALAAPGQLLIPESMARKWFGRETAVGKTVEQEGTSYTVAAVYRDMPANSVFKNVCYTGMEEKADWRDWSKQVYLLTSTTDRGALQRQVNGMKFELLASLFDNLHKTEEMQKQGKTYVRVTPLTDIFYDNTILYDKMDKGNRRSAWILAAVSGLILLIAGINFLNFSVSLAPGRMKSINTHKVLGATRPELRRKLITESVLYALGAFVVSVVLLQVFSMTSLASLFAVSTAPAGHLFLLAGVAVLAIGLGVLAGIYPAYYVTSFEPAMVLKGSFVMTPKGVRLRNALMGFQFVISITLIVCTLLIGSQYRFMQHYDLGFGTENIGWFALDDRLEADREALANELKSIPGVLDYTFSAYVPGQAMKMVATKLEGEPVHFDCCAVYKNYPAFFGIPLREGKAFSETAQTGAQILVNETALRKQPLLAHYMDRILPKGMEEGRLIGVVGDIHYQSLHRPVGSMALICSADARYGYMFLKLAGSGMPETLRRIEHTYAAFSPDKTFEFQFLDDTLQQSYESEKRLMQVISLMGGIAIVLALVGVYGLIIFNAQYKRKEIGVRKVNGATEGQILLLLNRSFFRLLAVSFVIACPLAWYAMSRWLEGFSYKTPIHWWIFLLSGLITLAIALLTVSWQSWKAATENPVKALKTE